MRRALARNTALNLSGAALPLAVALVTVPLYLEFVGRDRYGAWAVLWAVMAWFSVLDFGLGKAIVNRIANGGDRGDAAGLLGAAIMLDLALGIGGALLFLAAGPNLFRLALSADALVLGELLAAVPWLAALIPAVTLTTVATGALEGKERFLSVNVLEVSSSILFQVVPLLAALEWGPRLDLLAASAVAVRLVMAIVAVALAARACGGLSRPAHFPEAARSLLGFGGWITTGALLAAVLTGLDRPLISASLGAAAVAFYSLPLDLAQRLQLLPSSLARALLPRFSAMDAAAASTLQERALSALSGLYAPVIAAAMFALEPFLELWVGVEMAGVSGPIGVLLLAGMWVNGLAFLPVTLLQGKGRPDLPAIAQAVELPLFAAGFAWALWAGGLPGAAVAWTLRVAVDAIVQHRLASSRFSLPAPVLVDASLVGSQVAVLLLIQGPARTAAALVIVALAAARAFSEGRRLWSRIWAEGNA